MMLRTWCGSQVRLTRFVLAPWALGWIRSWGMPRAELREIRARCRPSH